MKYAVLLTAGAALALAACQASDEPASDASASATAAPEPAAPAGSAAAFTAGQPPSQEFMAGIWGEGEACEMPIDFQPDGTIKDGPFETWEIADGQLVMGDLVKLTMTVVDAETMTALTEGSTEPSTLKRCD